MRRDHLANRAKSPYLNGHSASPYSERNRCSSTANTFQLVISDSIFEFAIILIGSEPKSAGFQRIPIHVGAGCPEDERFVQFDVDVRCGDVHGSISLR
jgi:hypothetical protein